MKQAYDVYVSAPPQDPIVQQVVDRLGSRGVSFARGELGELGLAVRSAPWLLVFLGKGGLTSAQQAEVSVASNDWIVVILLPGAAGSLPGFAPHQLLDFREGVSDREVDTLAASILVTRRPPPALGISSSVSAVAERSSGAVSAAMVIRELLRLHPEYAGGRAGKVTLLDEPAPERSAQAWLAIVRDLFDPQVVPELHGRHVIIGLALVNPVLREQLDRAEAFAALAAEVTPPIEEALTPAGRELWPETAPPPDEPSHDAPRRERVPTHTDNPATIDALQRKGFARVLARRIRDMRRLETETARESGDSDFPRGRSFLVHIDGEWGAGKTSLLNFVAKELDDGDCLPPFRRGASGRERWIVVQFNAWQHQRIVPPWWWLMSAVARQGGRALWRIDPPRAVAFRVREWLWRAWAGWPWYLLALVGSAIVAILWSTGHLHSPKHPGGWIAAIGAAISAAVALWSVLRGVARSMLTSSTRGAREYLRHARDPMQSAKEHFTRLVDWLAYPIAIFVDDLDRCRDKYVVELLEGIQTLFRDVPVVYVVAADRDWLADSYANEYRSFKSLADEPGRPFGYLFLEKTFQLSASVPSMSESVFSRFWQGLITADGVADPQELERARKEADAKFADLETEDEIRREIVEEPGSSAAERQARVEAAAIKLAAPEHQADVEHTLAPFAELLDRNPRALKRLVNAYGVARDLEILAGRNLEGDVATQHASALWTILDLRWPKLADHLAEHPEHVDRIGRGEVPSGVPKDLRPLFSDERVIRVVRGEPEEVQAHLDVETLCDCLGRPRPVQEPAVS